MESDDPEGRVRQPPFLPELTDLPNEALTLSGPCTNAAKTLLGATAIVRQKASTKASKGRNRMRGSRKAR